MASIDQRDADVDQFIELAVEGASHAGVEVEKILKHLRAMGQRFLHVAGLAAKSFLVNLPHFRIRFFRADQADARH